MNQHIPRTWSEERGPSRSILTWTSDFSHIDFDLDNFDHYFASILGVFDFGQFEISDGPGWWVQTGRRPEMCDVGFDSSKSRQGAFARCPWESIRVFLKNVNYQNSTRRLLREERIDRRMRTNQRRPTPETKQLPETGTHRWPSSKAAHTSWNLHPHPETKHTHRKHELRPKSRILEMNRSQTTRDNNTSQSIPAGQQCSIREEHEVTVFSRKSSSAIHQHFVVRNLVFVSVEQQLSLIDLRHVRYRRHRRLIDCALVLHWTCVYCGKNFREEV